MSENPTANQTAMYDRMRDAALDREREQAAERNRISDLILGCVPRSHRLGDVIWVGSDCVAEVIGRNQTTWTTVVDDQRGFAHWLTQDEALLHLIAIRHEGNPDGSRQAAYYAARVLGIPEKE